jgi:hypothetical protein
MSCLKNFVLEINGINKTSCYDQATTTTSVESTRVDTSTW